MPAHQTLRYKKSLYKLEYGIWSNIKHRCLNPNYRDYKNYGGRGIAVCDRWRDSFDNFMDDMGPRPSLKHSIDRIDNNGNYEPSNCRWATYSQQNRNQRLNMRNSTGYRGVSPFSRDNCYQAGIQVDGKWKSLGLFKTLEEAVIARKEAELKYWKVVH